MNKNIKIFKIKEFKNFIKNKMVSINELKIFGEDFSDNNVYKNEFWYKEENTSVYVEINNWYDSTQQINTKKIIRSYLLLTLSRPDKYLEIFKKKNIKLTYNFIKYLIERTNKLEIIKWCLKNSDYLNNWLVTEPNDRDYWYTPTEISHFVYNCLRNNELDKVKLFVNYGININNNNLLERIYIELNSESEWDIFYLLNLFVLNKNFEWDIIDSILRIELLYFLIESYTINEILMYYPNIFKNKKIKKFLTQMYPNDEYDISDEKIFNYKKKCILYHEYNLMIYGDDIKIQPELYNIIRDDINNKLKILFKINNFII